MGDNEFKYMKEAFESNWIAPAGPHISTFEKNIKDLFNVEAAAVVSSGTAALHLALINLGIKQGDYVICQSMTFSASANPIVYQGAIPVFIDSEKETWNLDPDLVRKAIIELDKKGNRPKAIIAVHLYGMPAKMAELESISIEFDIPLIEDAAEAAGSKYLGKRCGSFGRAAVLSFNGNKIITTSGGGALLSNDWHMVSHSRFLSTQAKDPAPHYQHSHIGYNYRMSNISAAIGCGQLEVLEERVQQRRANYDFYFNELSDIPGISFLPEPYGHYSNRWLSSILVHPEKTNGISREHLRLRLEAEYIESRPLWKPLHTQPIFKDYPKYINGISESLFQNGLCLPSGSSLKQDERNQIVEVLKNCLYKN
jgi:dTDP-4-amino-4,6-dideoxygalactose transaminase